MTYFLRLACVCLASFFLIHIALGLAVLVLTPLATRHAERLRPAAGARLLFTLRLLPISIASLTVLLFCVPSYLRFEQDAAESIGYPCLLLSLAATLLIGASATRLVTLLTQSKPSLRTSPLFALVGILRPRLVVSQHVRQVLTQGQIEAAILHEEAHRQAHDNLKRLAIVASPGILPLHSSFRTLEQHWARMAEWAADDAAVAAEPRRAIDLAEALVRVARLSTRIQPSPLVSSLVASKDDLGERIQRLLVTHPATTSPRRSRSVGLSSAIAATAAIALLLPRQQTVLYGVHRAMELLVR